MSRPAASENPANDTDIIRNEPAVRLTFGRVVEAAAQQLLQGIVHFGVAGLGQLAAAAEALRVIEVLGGGEEVRVLPDGIASGNTALVPKRGPQRGRLAQAAGTKFQSHEGRERVLRRTAGGTAPPDCFPEVSSFSSACSCAGVRCGMKTPWESAS